MANEHKRTLDLTVGNYKSKMVIFAIPIFLSSLLQTLYNTIDSIIVGNYINKQALAAVSSSSNLIFLLNSFFIGMSMGAGILTSKFFGAKQYNKMSKSIHTGITVSFFSGILLTIVGVSLTPTILKWMNTDPNVLPQSIEYFKYYFLGCLAMVMYNTFNGILNAVGNSKRPLMYLAISSILNVILDIVFIRVFHGGVKSAAIATTISQFISAILCLIHLLNKDNIYHVEIRKIGIDKEMFIGMVKYGLPTGIQNSVIGLANVFVQSNINKFGEDAMAGCGSYNKLEGFVFLPIMSFTMAISTFIAQNLGANEFERSKKGAKFGIITTMIMAEIVGIVFYLIAPQMISIFNQDTEVIKYGTLQARTISIFFFLLAFSHCIASVARGAGKAIVPMIVMLAIWCVLRVTYIKIVMIYTDNIKYVFIAYPITWFISSIIYLIYFLKSDWVHSFIRSEERKRLREMEKNQL